MYVRVYGADMVCRLIETCFLIHILRSISKVLGASSFCTCVEYMGHYQKMEQSLSLMVFSQARCPRFAFSMYNISFRGALLEPHAISRFRVRYLQKKRC